MGFRSRRNRLRLLCSAVPAVFVTAAMGTDVYAQTATAAGGAMEVIIVTAEKRAENIQNVPIAITAFTPDTLQDKAIGDIHALSNYVPNVNLDQGSPFSGSNSVLSASIRGIGQDDFAFNLDPGVGVYVDGVYYARTVGANQNLLDVARVEILKGPQGTLFGRNTIGGAISIVTREPGDTFKVELQATGGSFSRHDFAGSVDIPISDGLAASFTISSEQREGYQKRIPYPSAVPYVSDPVDAFHAPDFSTGDGRQGGQNEQVARSKVVWKPTENWTITLGADWTHTNQDSTASTVLDTITSGPNAVFGAFYNLCLAGVPFVPTAPLVCGPRNTVGTPLWQANLNPATYRLPYGPAVTNTGNIDTTYATGANFDKMDSYGGSLTVNYALTDNLDIKSITGYRRLHWVSGMDADGSPIQFFELHFRENQHQISEELQAIGTAFDSRLHYVGGLYFFNEGGGIHDYVTFGTGLLQIDGPNTLDTSSYAVYGHADYALTDAIGLTLGARYSIDNKSFTGGQQDLNDFFYKISGCYPYNASASLIGAPPTLTCQQALGFPNPQDHFQVYPPGQNKQKFYVFTPTAGVQYHFDDDVMAYASYSKGFKSGGWTTRLTAPLPVGSPAPTFGPEKDTTYEVGLKSEWLDHRLQVNLAGFDSDYKDIQLTYQISTSPVTQNAGDARILGMELETHALLGYGFQLNASMGYMDAHYTKILAGASSTTGRELPKTPKWKFDLSPEYDMDLGNASELRFGLDYTHISSMFNDVANTPLLSRPAVDLVNASVTYASPNDHYELAFGGSNLTNARYVTTGQPQVAGGVVFGTYSAPSEWFLTLRVKY